MKALPRDISVGPSITSREAELPTHLKLPVQLSEAVRRLAIAAYGRAFDFKLSDAREPNDVENIPQIMNNPFSFSHPKQIRFVSSSVIHNTEHHHLAHQSAQGVSAKYSLLTK